MKNTLIEKSAYFNKTVKEIAELTDINHHTEALIEGARLMRVTTQSGWIDVSYRLYTNYERIFKNIADIADIEGYMPPELSKYCAIVRETFFTKVKEDLDPVQYKKFHGAY